MRCSSAGNRSRLFLSSKSTTRLQDWSPNHNNHQSPKISSNRRIRWMPYNTQLNQLLHVLLYGAAACWWRESCRLSALCQFHEQNHLAKCTSVQVCKSFKFLHCYCFLLCCYNSDYHKWCLFLVFYHCSLTTFRSSSNDKPSISFLHAIFQFISHSFIEIYQWCALVWNWDEVEYQIWQQCHPIASSKTICSS